jgi:hypothetical protein
MKPGVERQATASVTHRGRIFKTTASFSRHRSQTTASLLYLLLYSNGDMPVTFLNTSRNAFTSE